MTVQTYSLQTDGDTMLSANFKVAEFRCKDGSDEVKIDSDLVVLLQQIRDYFAKPITINSAYRTASYNAQVGGSSHSQHVLGKAADIVVQGLTPLALAQYVEFTAAGGIGLYTTFTHVDTRSNRVCWDQRGGKQVVVKGFGGEPPQEEVDDMTEAEVRSIVWEMLQGQSSTPSQWAEESWKEAQEKNITDGSRPKGYATREEVTAMVLRS